MKKLILSFFIIGFLFNIFHDFVFYKIDPCLSYIETSMKFDEGKTNDPLCEIHQELHHLYLNGIPIQTKRNFFRETYYFSYDKPFLKQTISEIFKPPKHLA